MAQSAARALTRGLPYDPACNLPVWLPCDCLDRGLRVFLRPSSNFSVERPGDYARGDTGFPSATPYGGRPTPRSREFWEPEASSPACAPRPTEGAVAR